MKRRSIRPPTESASGVQKVHDFKLDFLIDSTMSRIKLLSLQIVVSNNIAITSRRCFSTSHTARNINKVVSTASEAIDKSGLKSKDTILAGGFGLCGIPSTLIKEIQKRSHIKDLTIASNNCGVDQKGLGLLLENGQITKLICSYVGENKLLEKSYLSGAVELQLVPQGTLAEKCRAAGAGIPAFYTPAGVGTFVESGELPMLYNSDGTVAKTSQPKETRVFNGKKYILEEALFGDVAIIKAYQADKLGNVRFRATELNFNGAMARAANKTIVEVDEIVPVGTIPPTNVHIPGVYVDTMILSSEPKYIERETLAKSDEELKAEIAGAGSRARIVKRAAQEFTNGMYANLGIGMPTLAPTFVDPELGVQLQSENGVLGVGPYPTSEQLDPDYINAGKETITLSEGASIFGSEESFGMIRSGRINMSMLGAMQVSQHGDLANWMLPGKVKGMGGAMDLVANPERTKIVVTMEHVDKKGRPKIVETCTFPLTGAHCVSRIITEMAVFDVEPIKGLTLIEIAPGLEVGDVEKATGASFEISPNLKTMEV
jgi:3-oxoacid CoA-transferase